MDIYELYCISNLYLKCLPAKWLFHRCKKKKRFSWNFIFTDFHWPKKLGKKTCLTKPFILSYSLMIFFLLNLFGFLVYINPWKTSHPLIFFTWKKERKKEKKNYSGIFLLNLCFTWFHAWKKILYDFLKKKSLHKWKQNEGRKLKEQTGKKNIMLTFFIFFKYSSKKIGYNF